MAGSGTPSLHIGEVKVIGRFATGVAINNQATDFPSKSNAGQGDATSSWRPNKLSVDYTEYADPKNIDKYHFDDSDFEEDKKKTYEKYKVSGKGIKKRGYALIINVLSKGEDERKGSEIDVEKMESLWKKFKFEVIVRKLDADTDQAQIKTELEEAAGQYGGVGMIVIIIMSHGKVVDGEEVFVTSDRKFIKFNDVISVFDNKNARSLCGIPKLFFLQYCRGNLRDFLDEDEDITAEEWPMPESEEDNLDEDGEVDLPLRSDMLIAHASMEGYRALRNPTQGSYFFNAIANVFLSHAKHEHVLELMTRVNSAMAAKTYDWEGKKRKQMNEVKFDLRKRLYLLD